MLRVTPHHQLLTALQRTQTQTARTQQIQTQISSGLRIQRPSDDPAGHREVLSLDRFLSSIESDTSTMQYELHLSNQSHTQVRDAQQLIVQARDITLQARQATDVTERQTLAAQIGIIRDRLIAIGNTQIDGRYLFGGTAADAPPLQTQPSQRVQYVGGSSTQSSAASKLPTGLELFFPNRSPGLSLVGKTGARLGPGIPVGQGRSTIKLQHQTTLYQPGSGIQPGTASPGGDTVLGELGTHQLTINDTSGAGANGTISLNGGPPVLFTALDTNLLVTGRNGEQVYVDTSGISAGFNGTVDLEATGTIKLDDGPAVAVTFATNQQLFDSTGNLVRYIDTTQVNRAGTETLEPTLGTDLFTSLQLLQEDILAGSAADDPTLGHRLNELELLSEHALGVIGRQSVGIQQLDESLVRLTDLKLAFQERLGNVQSADLADAVLRLQEQQSQTEFSLSTAIRTFNISILDFLG